MFEGPDGTETLADLFAGRSQLIVYHFMFHPDDKAGCPHCSLRADGFAGIGVHLNHRDVTMVVVSRAPYGKLAEYRKRMGWGFKWVSSGGSDFNFDYQASFTPEEMAAKRALYNFAIRDPKAREREGHSIFYKDPSGTVFHTYSCYDRGNDKLNLHYHYLDLVPKGRDEGRPGPVLGAPARRVRSLSVLIDRLIDRSRIAESHRWRNSRRRNKIADRGYIDVTA